MAKHNQYGAWEAQRLFSHHYQAGGGTSWKPHQWLKYRMISSPLGGLAFLLGSFLLMGGWRDGSVGFAFC